MIDRIGGWPRPLTCTIRDALYWRSCSCPNISIESMPKMVVKRVGMSTTPLGMYLQIKNHHEQHPQNRERHLQCAHRKDFKNPRGTDRTSENWCRQGRFRGGDSSSESLADLFIVTVYSLTQSKARSYLREDSFEMTSIRRNSSFYTLATVQRLLGHCSTCSDMSGKRVKTEVIKTPVFAGGVFILHLQR